MARNKEPLRSHKQLVAEIERVRKALDKTKSVYLKREYTRHLWRMQKELRDYDKFHEHKKKRIIIVRCTDGRKQREVS